MSIRIRVYPMGQVPPLGRARRRRHHHHAFRTQTWQALNAMRFAAGLARPFRTYALPAFAAGAPLMNSYAGAMYPGVWMMRRPLVGAWGYGSLSTFDASPFGLNAFTSMDGGLLGMNAGAIDC